MSLRSEDAGEPAFLLRCNGRRLALGHGLAFRFVLLDALVFFHRVHEPFVGRGAILLPEDDVVDEGFIAFDQRAGLGIDDLADARIGLFGASLLKKDLLALAARRADIFGLALGLALVLSMRE